MFHRSYSPDVASHPSKTKRAWAAIVDLLFTLVPTIIFFILFYTLTIDLFDTRSMFDEVAVDQLQTHLYVQSDDARYPVYLNSDMDGRTYESSKEQAESYGEAVERYREGIVYYYRTYKTTESPDSDEMVSDGGGAFSRSSYYTNHWINVNVLGISEKMNEDGSFSSDFYTIQNLDDDPLTAAFTFSSSNEEGSEAYYADLAYFYAQVATYYYSQTGTGVYSIALDDYASETHVLEWDSVTNMHTFMYYLISFIPSAGIFWFIIPIFSPYGQTLGKRIFKIFVVTRDDEMLPRTRIGYRSLFEWILISVSFGFTFGLISLVDVMAMALTRNQRTITDTIMVTSVTDDVQ